MPTLPLCHPQPSCRGFINATFTSLVRADMPKIRLTDNRVLFDKDHAYEGCVDRRNLLGIIFCLDSFLDLVYFVPLLLLPGYLDGAFYSYSIPQTLRFVKRIHTHRPFRHFCVL